jgi:hypothetical protein
MKRLEVWLFLKKANLIFRSADVDRSL